MKRLRWGDFLALIIAAAVVFFLAAGAYGDAGGAPMVLLESDEGSWIYPLDEDRVVPVHGLHGDTVVEIHEGMVDVIDSPCRDKICVFAQPLTTPGDWTACLPNNVFIQIQGDGKGEFDDISF